MTTRYTLDVLALNEDMTVEIDSGRYICQTIQTVKIAHPRELTIGRIAPHNYPDIPLEDISRIISRKQGIIRIIDVTPNKVPRVEYQNIGKNKPVAEFRGETANQRELEMQANKSIPIYPGESLTFGEAKNNWAAPYCIVYAEYPEIEDKNQKQTNDSAFSRRFFNFFKRKRTK